MLKWWKKWRPNPLDSLLKKAARKGSCSFLIFWNRGLGDIPLGLYALQMRIRQFIPDATITFVTRADLKDGFRMLEDVSVVICSFWQRGAPTPLTRTLLACGLCHTDFDVIIERPDPTDWLKWQLGSVMPVLKWKAEWDSLCTRFDLTERCLALHVHTETSARYGYEKNWPAANWQKLIDAYEGPVVLFGKAKEPLFQGKHLIDLRGQTTLLEMLSVIKNCTHTLIAPDSGVLSITYYLGINVPLKLISLWADPRQGILKQNVASPNPSLIHCSLLAKEEKMINMDVHEVLRALH